MNWRLLTAGCLWLAGRSCLAAELPAWFTQANELYEAGRFAEAAALYEQGIAQGYDGPDVLYNLGNAYARQHQLGKALAAYEAARRLAPRDPDIRYNLTQTAAMRVNVVPEIPGSWLASVITGGLGRFTLNELTAATLALLVVCCTLGVLVLLRLGPVRRLLAALGLAGLMLVAGVVATVVRYNGDYLRPPAFIGVSSATARSGPGESFEVTGSLPDGTRVEPRAQVGVWVEVVLRTGKAAWVRREDLARR